MNIETPASDTVELKAGWYHVMFLNPKQDLTPGDQVRLTLQFEKAGNVRVEAEVIGH